MTLSSPILTPSAAAQASNARPGAAMVWLDGTIVEGGRAPFDMNDRGLLLGDGVFETALVLNGRSFRLNAHLERLRGALDVLAIEADWATIVKAAAALLPHGDRHALRVTVTRGPGLRGLTPRRAQKPTVLASLSPLPAGIAWPRLSLEIADIRRNETSPASKIKALSYLDAVLALRAAAARGHDDVVFLNSAARVACASAGNLFALIGGALVTPPVCDGVLPGIIRGFLLGECGKLGLVAQERSLTLNELQAADAIFMSNSLRLIAPVERIGDIAIGSANNAAVASLQQHLRQAIEAECGIAP